MGRRNTRLILIAAGVLTAVLSGVLFYDQGVSSVWDGFTKISFAFYVVVGPILLITLSIALPVGIAVWVVRAMGGLSTRAAEGEKSARDILDERFARGEIDKDEYEQSRLVLSS